MQGHCCAYAVFTCETKTKSCSVNQLDKQVPKTCSITWQKTNKEATESAPIVCDSTTGQQYFVSAPSPSLKHADRPQQKPHNTTLKGGLPQKT